MASTTARLGVIVARMVGDSPVMDEAAAKVKAEVVALASRHSDTGAYVESIKVERIAGKKGVTDRAVYSDDPNALSIEYGHLTRPKKGGGPRRWVNGLHIMGEVSA